MPELSLGSMLTSLTQNWEKGETLTLILTTGWLGSLPRQRGFTWLDI